MYFDCVVYGMIVDIVYVYGKLINVFLVDVDVIIVYFFMKLLIFLCLFVR